MYSFVLIVWCGTCGMSKRTWDMTPPRDLQFYRNEIDMLDRFGVIWVSYTDEIIESLPSVCKE